MKIRDIMTQSVVAVREEATLDEAAQLLLKHRIGGLPVVDRSGQLCGIVTESDFTAKEQGVPFSTLKLPQVFSKWMPREGVERIYEAARQQKVKEIMTRNVITVGENDPVEQALSRMLEHDVHRLPVVREGKPIGIVARHDLLKLMAEKLKP